MFKSSEILNNAQMRRQRVRGGFESLRRLREMLLDYLVLKLNEAAALYGEIMAQFPRTVPQIHIDNLQWFINGLQRMINRITTRAHPVGIYAPPDFDANIG